MEVIDLGNRYSEPNIGTEESSLICARPHEVVKTKLRSYTGEDHSPLSKAVKFHI